MRYALKVAYDGSAFHGSQRQEGSDLSTVEGEILKTLDVIGGTSEIEQGIHFSSRTDAGVSSLGNVMSVDTDRDIIELMRAMNANLSSIWLIAYGRMRESQNIRWANTRWYRYHLPPGRISPDMIPGLNDILRSYVGENDYVHLCRFEKGRNTRVLIERASASDMTGNGEMVAVDISGSRFVWQQVRRMVGAALNVLEGEMQREDLVTFLDGGDLNAQQKKIRDRIPTMPPTGLLLMNVDYKDIEFTVDPSALEVARNRLIEDTWGSTMKVVLYSALRSLM